MFVFISRDLYGPFVSLWSTGVKLLFQFQIVELPKVVSDLCRAKITWDEVMAKYPRFEQQEATKDKGDE